MYVRRAYRAYSIQNISHDLSCRDYRIIEWRFLLPNSHPNMQVFAGFGKVGDHTGIVVCGKVGKGGREGGMVFAMSLYFYVVAAVLLDSQFSPVD